MRRTASLLALALLLGTAQAGAQSIELKFSGVAQRDWLVFGSGSVSSAAQTEFSFYKRATVPRKSGYGYGVAFLLVDNRRQDEKPVKVIWTALDREAASSAQATGIQEVVAETFCLRDQPCYAFKDFSDKSALASGTWSVELLRLGRSIYKTTFVVDE